MAIPYRGPAVFLPADPPRSGLIALLAGDGQRPEVTLFLPLDKGPTRTRLAASVVPMRTAVPWLGCLEPDTVEPSLASLARAVRAALVLIAEGRLYPAWTAAGFDCWRVGPLDKRHIAWADALGQSMPLLLQAVPAAPSTDRVWAPAALIRECWDAVADVMVRTAAADGRRGVTPFASRVPVPLAPLDSWMDALDPARHEGATAGLRLEVPDDPRVPATAVAFLRSGAGSGMAVDARELGTLPADEAALLGAAAPLELLEDLQRVEHLWPPVRALLDAPYPDRVDVDAADVDALLAGAGAALIEAGVGVVLPDALERIARIEVTAVVADSRGPAADGVFSLAALCDFHWEPTLNGERLSSEEIALLRAASGPLVRLRGQWVRTDPGVRARLAEGRGQIRAGDALAATLSGAANAAGETVALIDGGGLAQLAAELRAMADPVVVPAPPALLATLRAYQLRGLAWLAAISRLGVGGCLADDMGLGKTVQIIALHLHRSAGPMLVACPASMLGTWERELHRFAPSLRVRRYHGGERHLDELGGTEVVLVTYAVVRRDAAVLAEVFWDLVVADEAQHVKNAGSATARALRRLRSQARIALTGTPIENRLTDLWAILDWTTPGLLGSVETFRRRVARPVELGRDDEVARRFVRTVRPFLLRRRKDDPDIAPELPAKTEADLLVGLTSEQSALYEAVVQETLEAIRGARGISRRGLVLRLLTALKQVCNHPAQYLRQEGPLEDRSGKLEALDELLDVIIAEGDSTLVFTQYVAMAKLIESHLTSRGIATVFLHGGVAVRRRDALVQRFQDGEVPVFLLSLRAGGVGLTLTRATHVIHYDRWWNPAVEDQATDRAHRIGQARPVEIHRIITEGTLEDRIASLLSTKRALAETVLGTGETWISEMTDEQLADLVALHLPS